jgi:putative transposase
LGDLEIWVISKIGDFCPRGILTAARWNAPKMGNHGPMDRSDCAGILECLVRFCPPFGRRPARFGRFAVDVRGISLGWRWLELCKQPSYAVRVLIDIWVEAAMTLPREIVPGRFYMVTRRCTQRQLLLRPDEETNNAFLYCLAEAAQRFGIEVVLPCAMSNHHHTVVFDRHGNLPAFTEHFHKLLAKCQNALRGRWENLWASEQVSTVRLVDTADVLRKVVYAATNPVKDRLVERAYQWPGVNGLTALLARRPLQATRPRHFFRPDGTMPVAMTLHLVLPPELGDPDQFRAELRRHVEAVEGAVLAERMQTGACILGRRAVLQQSWRAYPRSEEPRRQLRPRVACGSQWARVEAHLRNRQFLTAYRAARDLWLAGKQILFPVGTYWLRRFAHVPLIG